METLEEPAPLAARGRTGGSANAGTAFEIPATQVTQTKDGVVPEFRWLSPNLSRIDFRHGLLAPPNLTPFGALGIDRSTLYEKIKRYEIPR